MTENKSALINLFIKKASLYNSVIDSIGQIITILQDRYPHVDQEDIDAIIKKYSINEYIRRLAPIIDAMFDEDELNICIKFYSSEPGKKLFNSNFLSFVQGIGDGIFKDMEKDFVIKNNFPLDK